MALGIVKRFNDMYGWGFITDEHGVDHFVHYSFIQAVGYKTLDDGGRVSFDSVLTPRGPQAHNVVKLPAAKPEPAPAAIALRLKHNPFTPQDPVVDPTKFAGRREALANAIDAVFNNRNVLISGARGIGKSSVAYQLLYMAKGETILLDRLSINTGGFKFNYLTADHRCLPTHGLDDVINGLLASLRASIEAVGGHQQATRLGLLSLARAEDTVGSEVVNAFAAAVEHAASVGKDKNFNGVCLLLDEIDCLLAEVPLAPFFKVVTEKLRLDRFRNISFIAAGVTGTITALIGQHASAGRIFENIELQRMEPVELAQVIDTALAGTGTSIDMQTRNRIIALSDRFPAPVHRLGYHAFQYDEDDIIDLSDLRKAQDYIVQKLRTQEFEELHRRAGEGSAILEAIAAAEEDELSTGDLAKRAGFVGQEGLQRVEGVLTGQLMRRDLVARGSRRDFYRIREPLFKIYLRWILNLG